MKKLTFITLMAIGLLSANHLYADTWRVNNNPLYTDGCDHCFSELQEAVNSAMVSPGDTIHVEASGINYDGADITKELTIIGTGYFLNENGQLQQNQQSSIFGDPIVLAPGSEGSEIIGLVIDCFNWALLINTSNITIQRCYFNNQVHFYGSDTIYNIIIKQCFINSDLSRWGNSTDGPVYNLHVSNCFIKGVTLEGGWYGNNLYEGTFTQNVVNYYIEGSNNINYYNNIIIGNFAQDDNTTSNVFSNIFTSPLPTWLSGGSNVYVDPVSVFTAEGSTDGVLLLNPPSICPECYQGYDPGGVDDEEIGMFGGATPYVLSGIPNIPTVYELHSSPDVYQGDTTHVNISTRSNN